MPGKSNSVIRNLQIVFFISTLLLLVSLVSSLYSTKELVDSSKMVNHTNEVLIEAENLISYMKDAETGQRGYIITLDPVFLEPYKEAKINVSKSSQSLKNLTVDNPVQQKNIEEANVLIGKKMYQMQKIIGINEQITRSANRDTITRYNEMMQGKIIMDDLRKVVNNIKQEEKRLLEIRSAEQDKYVSYTPILVIAAALLSILITLFSYIKIKRDLDERIKKQLEDEAKYKETSERINQMEGVTRKISGGDYSARTVDDKEDELGRVSKALNVMTSSLENTFTTLENKAWLQEGSVKIADAIRGERDIKQLTENLLTAITSYIQAPIATFYVNSTGSFTLTSSYSVVNAPKQFLLGDGLIGQAAKNKSINIISNIPPDFVVSSSIGNTLPVSVLIVPLVYENETIAVMELGFLREVKAIEKELMVENVEAMAIGVNSTLSYIKLQNLLEETQAQTEELQAQHSEMENLNSELEAQSQQLQASEEELKVQQEELQQTNEELEERTLMLEERNTEIRKKAEELELSTKYKSEFLANMSHELRTPLNSILLLSRLLSENNEKNLSEDQTEYARVIQSSGNGLLGLIDEILDLSKIEAGKMELEYLEVATAEITEDMSALFRQVAKNKQLEFNVSIQPGVPEKIETDKVRLEQILKNLISNALKFTTEGFVNFEIKICDSNDALLCFIVKDSGIGIPKEKQGLIFEAFQQADGSTKRKFGGTGLGLSISRELTKLLGGDMHVNSVVNEGSEFILRVPLKKYTDISSAKPEATELSHKKQEETAKAEEDSKYIAQIIPASIKDDRNSIKPDDKVILIIEDDTNFAKSLLQFSNKKGYKAVVAVRGDEGLIYARKYLPVGILLDVQLPVKSGWEVMDELKADNHTRHIPVHMMSSYQVKKESLSKGAVDFINKPFAHEQMQDVFRKIEHVMSGGAKKVLIVEDNSKHAKALAYFLETFNISSEVKSNINDGVSALKKEDINCVILDMGIPDLQSYQLLEEAKKNPGLENLPIIIFTGKSLSVAEEQRIKQYADSIVVKTAHSYQRMLDEVSLFLHLVEEKKKPGLPDSGARKLGMLNEILSDKTVLVVDDDVRNIFSLSKALEAIKMNIVTAVDGKEALEKLKANPQIDVVLLDMMMPEMDGYETARHIRNNPAWKKLPVIAVTAKAMTGDREKCINAGASDYITKPVDVDQLLSLLRVWLYEKN
jgi:signal transduction histidine kinase/DNA-binding response OmpR family regulator/CHASE3 domain sensor protein